MSRNDSRTAYCIVCEREVRTFDDSGKRRYSMKAQRCYWHGGKAKATAAAKAAEDRRRKEFFSSSSNPVTVVFGSAELPCDPAERADMARRLVFEAASRLYGSLEEVLDAQDADGRVVVRANLMLPATCTRDLLRETLHHLLVAEQKRRRFRRRAA